MACNTYIRDHAPPSWPWPARRRARRGLCVWPSPAAPFASSVAARSG